MKLKRFAITAGLSGLVLAILNCLWLFAVLPLASKKAEAIGIIGGADGPTAMFLTSHIFMGSSVGVTALLGVAAILTALVCLIFGKTVANSCTVNTTVLSLLISASVALLLLFTRAVWGIALAVLPLGLIALYVVMRRKHKSVAGVVIDALTCLVYMPFFICAFANILA